MVPSNQQRCLMRQDVNTSPPPPVLRHVRNLRATDRTAFKHDLRSALARLGHPSTEQYNSSLLSVLDKHTPASERKVSVGKYCPWFRPVGNQLLTTKRQRRQAEKRRTTGLQIRKELYNKAKQRVAKLVQKAKPVFFYNSKIAAAASSKEIYSITNKLAAHTSLTSLLLLQPWQDIPSETLSLLPLTLSLVLLLYKLQMLCVSTCKYHLPE